MTSQPGALRHAIAPIALASTSLSPEKSGVPFGLHRGMTQDQVVRIVGQGAVEAALDDTILFRTVPKPHPAFESYALTFSPKDGLLKTVAIGKDIRSNCFGEAVHSSFIEIQDVIAETYGQPDIKLDYLLTGSNWKDHKDWMTGLFKEERTLATAWLLSREWGYGIVLAARALSSDLGRLELTYEFDRWEQYLDAVKKKAGAAF